VLTSTSTFAENADFIEVQTPQKHELKLSNNEITQGYGCNISSSHVKQIPAIADMSKSMRQGISSSCPTRPPVPPKTSLSTYLASGYAKLPDTSFTTQAIRTESYCVRYDGQHPKAYPEQPLPITSTQMYNEEDFLPSEMPEAVPHQVTSTTEFLAKETQFIAPERASGSRCVEWRQRQVSSTSGYVSVRYGKDKRLNKPIVFVQGYGGDFTDGFIMNTVANEKVQLDNFIADSYYLDRDTSQRVYNAGYDLVVFRYAKQDSGIESNAWALATLLEKLAKTSPEVKVVGHSMGGIVGKLAIMYMENKGKEHNVSDFVAIDSPFYGVHLPQDIRAFANKIETEAKKIRSCSLLFPWSSSKRSECRANRRRLKSINDIFDSYTFKQLDEDSPQIYYYASALKI
jgi:pimeloyl-ACP methyl ester carboxylesterase